MLIRSLDSLSVGSAVAAAYSLTVREIAMIDNSQGGFA